MAYDQITTKGSTSQLIEVLLRDSTTGQGKTGLAAASVTAYYIREGAAANASMTLDGTMVLGTWKTLGWIEIDSTHQPGLYQFGIPNAAVATGANAVTITFTATGVIGARVRLVLIDADLRNVANLGLTAVPSAAPGAANGIQIAGSNAATTYATLTSTGAFTINGTAQVSQTGDAYALVNGASGVVAIKTDTAAVKVQTDKMAFTVTNKIDANTLAVSGTAQTARDLGASVLISAGTGTGQLDVTSGVIKANLAQILGTALTETAGYLAAAFKAFFNIASPVLTTASVNQTGDSYARIGAAGASLTALGDTRIANLDATVSSRNATTPPTVVAIRTEMDSNSTKLANLDATISSRSTYAGADTSGTTTLLTRIPGTVSAQTGDAYARLGAPAGASVSADVAAVKTDTAAVKAKTDNLPASPAAVGSAMTLSGDLTSTMKTSVTTAATAATPTVTAGTVSDKTGYSLSVTPPTAVQVRTEMDSNSTKLANLDATVSSRLAPAGTLATVTNLTNAPTAGDLTTTMKTSVTTAATASTPTVASVTAAVTVGTNNDKTGYGLSAGAIQAIWDALTSALTTVGSVGKRIADYVDAAISSRNATAPPSAAIISAAVVDQTLSGHTTAGTVGAGISAASAPTAATVAAAVWDTSMAAHLTSGTTGASLNGAGSAGDPWTTPLPGAYGAGTAGHIVGTDIPADIAAGGGGGGSHGGVG